MSKNITIGPGFLGCLALLFVAFKLLGIINWSWWLVLLPILVAPILGLLVIGVVLFVAFLATLFSK